MGGAQPLALSAAFILEEGFPLGDLRRIADSMARGRGRAGVPIVTGDTKVVERGSGDGVYINTAGIGMVPPGVNLSAANARPGDAVILSGAIGDHGIAILTQREGLELEATIVSDSAPLQRAGGRDACRHPTRCGPCAIPRAAVSPARSTKLPRNRRVGIALRGRRHSRARGCSRRLRSPGARSALRGE